MLRTILKEVKEFKRASIATPIYMILEVLMEMLIPFLMASIIDQGVNAGDIHHIYKVGGLMIVAALLGLFAGMAGGRYGAKASAGLARNLREVCLRFFFLFLNLFWSSRFYFFIFNRAHMKPLRFQIENTHSCSN